MKKLRLYFCQLVLICIVFFSVPVWSAPVQHSVVVYSDGEKIDVESATFVDKDEVLVPVEILEKYEGAIFDPKNNRVYLHISDPEFRLETSKLDTLIHSGINVNFPIKEIGGKSYINVSGLEKVFGLNFHYNKFSHVPEISIGLKTMPLSERQLNKPRANTGFSGKMNVVWEHVFSTSGNLAKENKIKGLDVISPTWFAVVDSTGVIANKADIKYVQDAHAKGYKVWALISNSFDKDLTKKILADAKAQENIIKQVVFYASLYDLDGINIDFENIYDDDRDSLTAFVRDLTAALKEQKVVVSIDVTVPSNTPFWSPCYDRRELGKIVDYVMVMTYDEHWRKSPVSGSVASLGWVEKGIAATLVDVPKEKLLMGIPFYTREWEETKDEDGVKVQSRSLSMDQAEKLVLEHNVSRTWLEDKGQYYVEYMKDDRLYRIWLEDKRSIEKKASLVAKYGLAGVASWRKGFEKADIWDVLNTALKKETTK